MHITFSILKFYFNCRTIICYWSILFSNASMHKMEANVYCRSFFSSIMIQQTYQQYGLFYLLYVDSSQECSPGATLGRWHMASQLAQGTTPRPGAGSIQAPNEPTYKYPWDWMHFRTRFKIILPINIISILCALLNSAEMDGWTTVHTCTQSIQICLTWRLSNIKNSYYSMTVLGLRHASGQALQSLKEIPNDT